MARGQLFRILLVIAWALGASANADARQYGPGLQDLPRTEPATAPARSIGAVERDLAAMDAELAAALTLQPEKPKGTPLGMPAPEPRRTALIRSESEPQPARSGLTQTVLALGGVLMLIWGLAWMYRKAARATGGLSSSLGAGGRAPAGIVEILARYPLASRHTLVVLRFDRRVLLCSMAGGSRSSSAGMTVLCELDEPEDVASVLIKARDQAGESLARSFERSLREAERTTDAAVRTPATVRIPRPAPGTPAASTGPSALRRGLESMRASAGVRR